MKRRGEQVGLQQTITAVKINTAEERIRNPAGREGGEWQRTTVGFSSQVLDVLYIRCVMQDH